jgi:hypothetical protein
MRGAVRSPDACSILSAEAAEALTATAPNPRAWLALEQPGPWGRKAPSSSHLDRELGAELDRRAKAARVTLVLIRRPGRHADTHQVTRRALLASHPGAGWLEQGVVDDPTTLLDLDLESLAAGTPPGIGLPVDTPLVLVCTNGRRDLCCAEVGRDRVNTLAPTLGDTLWESSHLGGHRFAPTVLLLPSGVVLGRADASDVLDALDGRLPLHRYRGRTSLAPTQQAAEAYVLTAIGGDHADRLHVGAPEGAGPWEVTVGHDDARSWRVRVEQRTGLARPESCGRELEPSVSLVVTGAVATQG